MDRVTRHFPSSYVPPTHTLNVLFLAEGFTSAEQREFTDACTEAVDAILATTPFNITRYHPSWLNVYRYWTASAVHGPVVGTVPGDTQFRSTLDEGILSVDGDRVADLVSGLAIRGEEGEGDTEVYSLIPWTDIEFGQRLPILIVVLLPADSSGEVDRSDLSVPFVATTTDANWTQVVIRAIARTFWLGDEFEREGDEHLEPTEEVAEILDLYPNLLPLAAAPEDGPIPADCKWTVFLSSDELVADVEIMLNDSPEAADTETHVDEMTGSIALIEGAGGYRTGVYRAERDCLMRREIGGVLSPKLDTVGFCVICRQVLTTALNGAPERLAARHIRNQTLRFDEVKWTSHVVTTSGFPASESVTAVDPTYDAFQIHPSWALNHGVDAATGKGLWFSDLRLTGQPHTTRAENVAELIEFADLGVVFEGESAVTSFDVARALTAGPKLEIGTIGALNSRDDNYLWGAKLTLEDDYEGACPVRVEMSLVLKGALNDIEPAGLVRACKLLPQLGITWSSGGSKRVAKATGTVRLVLNNYLTMAHGTTDDAAMTMTDSNVAGVFTDSNTSGTDGRKRAAVGTLAKFVRENEAEVDALIIAAAVAAHATLPSSAIPAHVGAVILTGVLPYANYLLPEWATVFDFFRGNLERELLFTGVYGPETPAKRIFRVGTYDWPTGQSDTKITLRKNPRQGAYDNIHAHGLMGDDPYAPHTGSEIVPIVHAPACGEACFHLHWRWGPDNVRICSVTSLLISNSVPSQFRGWGYSHAAELDGAPLIPGNQRLRVALTHPDTERAAIDALGDGSVVVDGSTALDPLRKAIWYMVDVTDPGPGERQVILEQGIGWAFDYLHPPDLSTLVSPIGITSDPAIQSFIGSIEDGMFSLLYPWIRWFEASSCQIPEGTQTSPEATSMHDL